MQETFLHLTKYRCPECGERNIITDKQSGEYVCGNCGLVVAPIYSTLHEGKIFTLDQMKKRLRSGLPLTYRIHDLGLTTEISSGNIDKYGRPLSYEQKQLFNRLRKWQLRARISDRRELKISYGLGEISRLCNNAHLPKNVAETASLMLREVIKEEKGTTRKLEEIAAACVYLACKQARIPRSLKEIASLSRLDEKEIGKRYRYIKKKMDFSSPLILPSQYISKFCKALDLCGLSEEIALKIVQEAEKKRIVSGKNPISIAAASIYIASTLTGERRTQEEISKVAHCTQVTVRNRYKDLFNKLMIKYSL